MLGSHAIEQRKFKRPWILPSAVSLCQVALSGTMEVFIQNYPTSMKANSPLCRSSLGASFGWKLDPNSVLITSIATFWNSVVASTMFAITQYRIVYIHAS
ncbi:hypothetical protein BJ742DRAFT_404899 [Cladochytrium replicatum]|nr:hypothetical protein BJ742DRAFT_404899 [Cladochytrium replicatum]